MRTMFVEARDKRLVKLGGLEKVKEKRIGLISTVQYISQVETVKKKLKSLGKKVFLSQGMLTKYKGQILGCDVSAAEKLVNKVDVFLYLGDGKFHPLSVALKTGKKVYLLSPGCELSVLYEVEVRKEEKRRKVALAKFLSAGCVGIIVSTKPGQKKFKEAINLKKKLEARGKKAFIFVCDTLDLSELENFSCDVWVNTACQGLGFEKGVVNFEDVIGFL